MKVIGRLAKFKAHKIQAVLNLFEFSIVFYMLLFSVAEEPVVESCHSDSSWTRWFDRDDPDGFRDDESLPLLLRMYPGNFRKAKRHRSNCTS